MASAGILIGTELIKFVAPISVNSNQPAFVSDAISLRRNTRGQGAQRWEINAKLEPSNNSADFLVHSVVNGHSEVFSVKMPQVFKMVPLNITGNAVAGETAKGSTSVNITGTNLPLPKGEFINFANHDKVYLVTGVVGSTYTISPRLIAAVALNTVVRYGANTIMKARYDTDTMLGITYVDGIMSDPGTVKLIEDF